MFLAHNVITGRTEGFRGRKQREPMVTPEGINDSGYGSVFSISASISGIHSGELGILNCIRVYGGYNESDNSATLFDTDEFVEKEFFGQVQETSESDAFAINWCVY